MAKITVTLDGFEQTRTAVRLVPDQARDLLSTAVAQTTFAVGQRAKVGAPVASGTMRGAIGTTMPTRAGLTGRVVIDPRAYYWRFVEYGTQGIPARPFVRTAAELETNAFVARVRSVGVQLERDFATSRFL